MNGAHVPMRPGELMVLRGGDVFSFTQDAKHPQVSLSACLSLSRDDHVYGQYNNKVEVNTERPALPPGMSSGGHGGSLGQLTSSQQSITASTVPVSEIRPRAVCEIQMLDVTIPATETGTPDEALHQARESPPTDARPTRINLAQSPHAQYPKSKSLCGDLLKN